MAYGALPAQQHVLEKGATQGRIHYNVMTSLSIISHGDDLKKRTSAFCGRAQDEEEDSFNTRIFLQQQMNATQFSSGTPSSLYPFVTVQEI